MGLKDYKFYRDLKVLKKMIRETVIRVMPKAHKYPDALYPKRDAGYVRDVSPMVSVCII